MAGIQTHREQLPRIQFESDFRWGDKVTIDGGNVIGVVTGFCFYSHGPQLQVSWWNGGTLVEQWVADWRVEREA